MNQQTVAENWRAQTGHAKHAAALYYDGKTIYSYGAHFPIAFITGKTYAGKPVILWNIDRYSNSTSKHQNHVYRTLYNDEKIGLSTDLLKIAIDSYEFRGKLTAAIRNEIRKQQEERIREAFKHVKYARKYREIRQAEANDLQHEATVTDMVL